MIAKRSEYTNNILFRIIYWLILIFLCVHSPVNSSKPTYFSPQKTIAYKLIDNTELKLHVFNPYNHKQADTRPAVVFFFSGGWINGSPREFYPHCEYLASRGMVAISAEYRIKSRHNTTPRESVKDSKSAIRWIRQHAESLGIDPKRIAAGGASAGGHIAAAAGTATGFEEKSEDHSISSSPNALVLFYPVYDNGPGGFGYDKKYWKEFSPMHNINNETPPTIVFLGTNDKLIPVATAKKYKNQMEKKGLRSELFLYADQPHGFANFRHNKFYTKTIHQMDLFFESLGYLEGEPTL